MNSPKDWADIEPPDIELLDYSDIELLDYSAIEELDYSELSLLSLSLSADIENVSEWKPLQAETVKPVLPVKELPQTYGLFILTVAENVQAPVDLVHAQALGVLAGATRGRFEVDAGSWRELVTLFLATFAEPGERKSQVTNLVAKPLVEFESNLRIERKATVAYANERRNLETQTLEALRRKLANKRGADENTQAEYEATLERLNNCPEMFPPRLLVGDVTPEALTRTMSEQFGTVSVIQPEGGLISNLNGRYSEGQANLDLVNQAYGAEPVHVTRQGRGDIYIERPHMAIALNVQPAVFREMTGSSAMAGKGFLDRFLMVKPTSQIGHRLPETAKPLNKIANLDWGNFVKELAGYATELLERDEIVTLQLTPEAQTRFTEFRTFWEPRLLSELRAVSGWGSKFPGMVLRIAAIFALFNNPRTNEIQLEELNSALALVPYYTEHRRQLFAKGSSTRADIVLGRLCDEGRQQFSTREVMRQVQNQAWISHSLDKTREVREVLEGLATEGKIRKLPKHGKSELWELHPELLGLKLSE